MYHKCWAQRKESNVGTREVVECVSPELFPLMSTVFLEPDVQTLRLLQYKSYFTYANKAIHVIFEESKNQDISPKLQGKNRINILLHTYFECSINLQE